MAPRASYFELRSPSDLLAKLRHDYARLNRDPTDSYAAFDFFVTAYHMLDWLHPGDKSAQGAERDSSVLLQVCDHIANGMKHVELSYPRHKSVEGTGQRKGAFQAGAFQADAFDVGGLTIRLKGQAAIELGAERDVVYLAGRVLRYWEGRVSALAESR